LQQVQAGAEAAHGIAELMRGIADEARAVGINRIDRRHIPNDGHIPQHASPDIDHPAQV